MQLLVQALVAVVVFAVLAVALKWVCDKFFAGVQPAYWICGLVLVIVLLYAVMSVFGVGVPSPSLHWR